MTDSDQPITDEQLSAYLDCALDEPDAEAVERAMSEDPELLRRVAVMMRQQRLLRQHFNAQLQRPVPQPITEMLESSPRVDGSWWSALGERVARWSAAATPVRAMAAAMVVAVVVVGSAALIKGPGADNAVPGDSVLVQAWTAASADAGGFLDEQPSGSVVPLGEGLKGIIDLSFQHHDGRFCRQYRFARSGGSSGVSGVACRSGGAWKSVIVQRTGAPFSESGAFRAAGGSGALAVDRYITDRMSGDVLVGDDEAELIERDWARP